MADDNEHYTVHQEKWEDLVRWGEANPTEWDKHELLNNEELLDGIQGELQGRVRAQEERRLQGLPTDRGHADRIRKLEDLSQTVKNRIAYCKGEYTYDDHGQAPQAQQGNDEAEDMDINDPDDDYLPVNPATGIKRVP